MQVLFEDKVLSVIWLCMANKYLEHVKDEQFEREFDLIWKFWKTGSID